MRAETAAAHSPRSPPRPPAAAVGRRRPQPAAVCGHAAGPVRRACRARRGRRALLRRREGGRKGWSARGAARRWSEGCQRLRFSPLGRQPVKHACSAASLRFRVAFESAASLAACTASSELQSTADSSVCVTEGLPLGCQRTQFPSPVTLPWVWYLASAAFRARGAWGGSCIGSGGGGSRRLSSCPAAQCLLHSTAHPPPTLPPLQCQHESSVLAHSAALGRRPGRAG